MLEGERDLALDDLLLAGHARRGEEVHWLRGLLVVGGLVALMILLFLAAFVAEEIALAQIPDKYPAPGEMVDVAEYSLHLYCAGDPSGIGTPAIL